MKWHQTRKVLPILEKRKVLLRAYGSTRDDIRNLAGGIVATFSLLLPVAAVAQNYTRTDTVAYTDNLSNWVLGQVTSSTNVETGIVEFRAEYDPVTALPLRSYGPGTVPVPGKLQQTLTYNADGTVATVKDGNNNVTSLSNWYRSVPRNIQYADGTTQSAVVNDKGWITSVTEENGFTTNYGYDAMGRLASIVYPTGDSTAWNTTTRVFEWINFEEYGLQPGHWREHVRTGNHRKYVFYDALWRPVVEQEDDFAQQEATLRWSAKQYDAQGRVVFSSYSRNPYEQGWTQFTNTALTGVRTQYDVLGRVTRVEQDSELGILASTTEYLAGFMTRVTNPLGYKTLTRYATYDQPTYDLPVTINQADSTADNASTDIVRDVFGKPTALRRRNADGSLGVWRYYVYQADHLLCKAIEPETGATVYGYDFAGNLTKSASGLQGYGDLNNCNHPQAWASGRAVDRTYDARNRLSTLAFPDGRGNQSWSYTPDGLPAQITTSNETGGGGQVINAYSYNKRRLLTGESVQQPGWYTWGIGYGYDGNGSLASQTYPTGLAISYAPNALGQPTQAGSFASGVQYHPNGGIKQFTYGNGLVHTMQQNARALPSQSIDTGNALNHQYTYDANGNVTAIFDNVIGTPTVQHRFMTYDNLDRLTGAGSAMFGGSDHWHFFTYDALDNLKSWKQAGLKDYANYVYDAASNQLTNIKNTAGATVVGLSYDVQGNLANKNGQLYGFDYGNRLRTVPNKEAYLYDGHGRRVQTTKIDGSKTLWQYSQAGQMLFSWNGPTGEKTHENIYLGGSLVATVDHDWPSNTVIATKYQHTDALGSPVAVTDTAGTVIDRTNYEPYGAAINKPAYDGIGYTGHVMDGATGLTYMQQRYYDPGIGKMLSVDPVTAYGGDMRHFNVYAYAYNSPYKFTDPDGRCPMGCPDDIQPTIEDSATLLGWAADGLEAVDQFMTALGPQGSGLSKLSVAPLARMARPLAVEAKAAAQLAKNVAQGAKAEAKVAAEMGAEVAGKRVTLEASTGQRSVADIVTTNKGVVEVKSGGAQLSSGQKAIKADVEAGRPVTPRGQNAADAGLTPNQPVQMKCYDVKRC